LKIEAAEVSWGYAGRNKGIGRHMTTVNVRYMVDDIEAAVAFYTTHLGFSLLSKTAPAFADVERGGMGAGRARADGIVFISSWKTSHPRSTGSGPPACISETIS
jgi:catechol 2,3-dioxygenase-like lactoylglutathione lyase family enzyme